MGDTDVRDTGTPELSRRQSILPRLRANQGHAFDLYVVDGSGPDKLLLEGKITTNEHSSLTSFCIVLHKARLLGVRSPSMERVTTSDPAYISERMSEALGLVGKVLSELDKMVGRRARMEILNLCTENTLPTLLPSDLSAALSALRQALDTAYGDANPVPVSCSE